MGGWGGSVLLGSLSQMLVARVTILALGGSELSAPLLDP